MNNRGKNVGLLLTGMALGAALCGGAAAAGIVAVPTWQPIFVDGRQVEMEAYNINGSNYVKLRDAGKQVGFNVYWQDGVQVDTGSPYTGVAPVEEAAETEMDVSVIRQEVVDRTNQLRREAGIPALETDPMLTQAAQVRAEEMAAAGTYSHTRPDGSQYYTVADCPYMAENIHRIADRRLKTLGKGLAEAAVDDWAASSGHLKNILNDGLSGIGIGLARGVNAAGEDCWYCVRCLSMMGTMSPGWMNRKHKAKKQADACFFLFIFTESPGAAVVEDRHAGLQNRQLRAAVLPLQIPPGSVCGENLREIFEGIGIHLDAAPLPHGEDIRDIHVGRGVEDGQLQLLDVGAPKDLLDLGILKAAVGECLQRLYEIRVVPDRSHHIALLQIHPPPVLWRAGRRSGGDRPGQTRGPSLGQEDPGGTVRGHAGGQGPMAQSR